VQAPADIKYAGVVVSRAEQISEHAGTGWFLSVKDPLPVGTTIEIVQDGGAVLARVEGVVEATEGSGMRVRLLGDAKSAAVSAKPATNGAAPVAAMASSGVVAEPISALAAQSPADGTVGRSVGDDPSDGIVTDASSSGESAAIDATSGDGDGSNQAGRRKRRRKR